MTKPAGKVANKKRNINGKKDIIFACSGSGGAGFSFCCAHIVRPIKHGKAPIIKKDGGSHGIRPKMLNILVGSLSLKSLIHPKNG